MVASINAFDDGKLCAWISECTPDFDANIIDHNDLADMIGKAVVRAINHSRTSNLDLQHVEFRVRLVRS